MSDQSDQSDMFPKPVPAPASQPEPDLEGVDTSKFDWWRDEAIIVERQDSIAVYRNPRGHAVIRREARDDFAHQEEEDVTIIVTTPQAVEALISALSDIHDLMLGHKVQR